MDAEPTMRKKSHMKSQAFVALIIAVLQLIPAGCSDSGTPAYIPPVKRVVFTSSDEAWVLTGTGSLVTVSGSGQSKKATDAPTRIDGISFISPSQGWAVDLDWKVWRFDGVNWSYVGHDHDNGLGVAGEPGLIFADEKVGWARTLGRLFVTENGGSTWNKVLDTELSDLLGLFVLDSDTVFLYGRAGMVVQSNDRGQTWTDISLGIKQGVDSFACQRDGRECWAASGREIAAISDDSVRRLDLPDVFGKITISSISFNGTGGALLAGGIYGEHPVGRLFKTNDGGQTWKKMEVPQDDRFEHVASFGNTIWLASDTSIYRSSDGGASWAKVYDASK